MTDRALLQEAREKFLGNVLDGLLLQDRDGVPSNADKDNKRSVRIAQRMADLIGEVVSGPRLAGQTSGSKFEVLCCSFLKESFGYLQHLRPGNWEIALHGTIERFQQYLHLADITRKVRPDPELAPVVQWDYGIKPDITISRLPEPDDVINSPAIIVDACTGIRGDIRKSYSKAPILHACISCKWTLRSDRAQNARIEGINLTRNRRGHQPHFVVITGEPLPSRIASIAIGTGEIDCVYHFALKELEHAVALEDGGDACELLRIMVEGKRLKDITDLPLDIAV